MFMVFHAVSFCFYGPRGRSYWTAWPSGRFPLYRQAEEKFKELAEAYATLSNSEKRKQYDMETRLRETSIYKSIYIYIDKLDKRERVSRDFGF